MRGVRFLGTLLVFLCAGCPSFATLKTARAIDKGDLQLNAAPTFELFDSQGTTFSYPGLEVSGRYGIADGFDLGLMLSTSGGGEIQSTIQLRRGRFDLALAPAIGAYGVGGTSLAGLSGDSLVFAPLSVPLLMGLDFKGGHQLVFGPKLTAVYLFAQHSAGGQATTSTSGLSALAGALVGFSFKLGHSFRLMPEIDVLVPFAETASFGFGGATGSNAVLGNSGSAIVQGGLSFSFGADGFEHPP